MTEYSIYNLEQNTEFAETLKNFRI